jgi:hypothetical protein
MLVVRAQIIASMSYVTVDLLKSLISTTRPKSYVNLVILVVVINLYFLALYVVNLMK